MKKVKILVAFALLLAMCLPLVACGGISAEDVIGTWSGSYYYGGNHFSAAFELSADGTFAKVVLKNGNYNDSDSGRYEISGNKVTLINSDNSMTTYEYKNGYLYNNNHQFTKD